MLLLIIEKWIKGADDDMHTIGFNNQSTLERVVNHPWQENYTPKTTIFGQHTYLPINFQSSQNDNVLVLGSSGTGKTYSFVEPNILQAHANYVVADAKGDILAHTGASLKRQGYRIQVLNLVDPQHSMTYNPLAYMHNDLDIMAFADQAMITDVTGHENNSTQDPFWNKGAETILRALILFTKEFLPPEAQTMATVTRLFEYLDRPLFSLKDFLRSLGASAALEVNYDYDLDDFDGEAPTIGDGIFALVAKKKPQSAALRVWNSIKGTQGSEKTWSSLIGILGSTLSQYMATEVENLLGSNQLDFAALLKPKTALFILYDDADPAKNFISNTLYSQLFSYLYHVAFHQPNNQLPVKVRFFLDDFKNIQIPHFDDYLATSRSRNISICMMLQDESQLRAKFGTNSASVIGNCSAYLLTGTTDLAMARDASERFNRSAQAIRLMSNDEFLLDVGGHVTKTKRYDYHQHPNYYDQNFAVNTLYSTPQVNDQVWKSLRQFLSELPGIQVIDGPSPLDLLDVS